MWKPAELEDTLQDRDWLRYCGFLNLSIEEFQAIQNELLAESLQLLAPSGLGKALLHGKTPKTIQELQQAAPLTTYQDYAPYFDHQDDSILPEKPIYWAFTTTVGGSGKWVPFTAKAHQVMLNNLMASFLLASSTGPGQGRIKKGDMVMYNVAPRPFLSGYMGCGMCEDFGFNTVPPLAVAEQMGIAERVEKGFQMSLSSGVDVLCSLSSVLVKMGEHFTEKAGSGRHSLAYLHPATLLRLARAYIRSRLEKRPILPKDLWQVKALISWGLDTSLYRQKIEHYWGITPYEFHACTEAGVLALQGWNKRGLTPAPLVAFFEFIPEEESVRSRQLAGYHPDTVLLNEVEAGKRYELVITSFHGMPFIRYRVGHLIKVLSLNDPETGASLPQLAFVGRSDDVIDLAGFTRLDEKTLAEAIYQSQLLSLDWIVAKEYNDSKAVLHLYIEAKGDWEETEVVRRVHQNLKCLDPGYRDVESMLGLEPLQVSLLAPGTFQRYYQERQRLGEDEIQARLPRINPPPAAMRELIRINNDTITEVACFSTDFSPSLP